MNKSATTFEVVRLYDPVIRAKVSSDIASVYATDRDLSILELGPNDKPITFKCRALTRDQRRHVREISSEAIRRLWCFRYGVLEIHNLPSESGGLRSWSPSRQKNTEAISDEALDATGLGDVDIEEIGSAIEGLSFLAVGVPPHCVVPPFSQRAWDNLGRFPVGQKQEDETQTDE